MKTRRLTVLLLALCLLTALLPVTAMAESTEVASGTCGDNLTWVLTEDGMLTISGEGAMYDYRRNSAPWVGYVDSITSVVIENGVTTIGSYALSACSRLTNIDLPDGLEKIGNYAFRSCTGISALELPASLSGIGERAFFFLYRT